MSNIYKQFRPKENSKTQKEKQVKKYNVIGCNCCHATSLPLIKAKDSYYCKFCFTKLGKEKG